MAVHIGRFTGFPPEAFAFYADLTREGNNTRAWFDEHRDVYERCVRLPMEELLDRAAEDGFGEDGKVFRPNRDVRFSKDKRPYKDHCGAVIGYGSGTARAGVYVQVGADGLFAATGYWQLSRDQLDRFRRAVADGRTGGAWSDWWPPHARLATRSAAAPSHVPPGATTRRILVSSCCVTNA